MITINDLLYGMLEMLRTFVLRVNYLLALLQVNVPIIWVLGGPGCGKGTQCAKIVEKYNFTHLSSGDLLRAEVASGSEKGKELAAIMKEGKLVSNEAVLHLLECAIRKSAASSSGFLIDGYPREKDQGAAFEKQISPASLILFFDCADVSCFFLFTIFSTFLFFQQTLVDRILARAAASKEVRADDNEETLKTRIATFRSNTNDILAQYTEKTAIVSLENQKSFTMTKLIHFRSTLKDLLKKFLQMSLQLLIVS